MRILKYIFLLLLLVTIALTVFIATQEGKYDIRKEKTIGVQAPVIFNYINDYRNWENVGILTNNDTTAVYSFSDITFGQGAKTSWKLDGSDGSVETIRVAENDSIIQKAVIDDYPSDISWGFKKAGNATKVSVRIKGELSFKDKAYAVLQGGVQERLESTLDKGLENLNKFLVYELGAYKVDVIGVVNKTGTYYLQQAIKVPAKDATTRINEITAKLIDFAKTNKIVLNGAPFVIYTDTGRQGTEMQLAVCIPIKEEIFTMPGSEYEGGRLEGFQALKTTLHGDYSHLKKAWDASAKEVKDKALQENTGGQYIEVYTKNVQQTKKPSAWVTDIYTPIGPNTGVVKDTVLQANSVRPALTTSVQPVRTSMSQARAVTPAANRQSVQPARSIPTSPQRTSIPATSTPSKPANNNNTTGSLDPIKTRVTSKVVTIFLPFDVADNSVA
jgi:effector-binding domain-containing protein